MSKIIKYSDKLIEVRRDDAPLSPYITLTEITPSEYMLDACGSATLGEWAGLIEDIQHIVTTKQVT